MIVILHYINFPMFLRGSAVSERTNLQNYSLSEKQNSRNIPPQHYLTKKLAQKIFFCIAISWIISYYGFVVF